MEFLEEMEYAGDIPEGWKWVKLGEIVFINSKNLTSNYQYDEIYYLETGSIVKGRLVSPYKKFYLKEAPRRAERIVNDGDIVYSLVRPIQRHYGIIKNPPENLIVSTGFAVITADNSKVDNRFIYYYLTLDEIVEYLDSIAEGSTTAYPSIVPDDLKNLIIPLPPLPEQKAIAEVLSSIDDKMELLHRQNKTLEKMAMTLFRQWFIEPTKDGLPEGWEIGKLEENLTIVYGKNLPTNKLKDSGYPVFGGNGKIGYYTEYMYEEPQVLISCRGEASGKVNISDPKSYITNNSLVLERTINKNISFEYLKYYCLNYDFTQFVSGSAQPQITIEELKNAEILLPPNTLINKFSYIISNFETKIISNKTQIQTLEKLRDTLLPKLMSGEIRVKI